MVAEFAREIEHFHVEAESFQKLPRKDILRGLF